MKILIIAENGRKEANRHLFLCNAMEYWLNNSGAEAVCWGPGHQSYETPIEKMVADTDVILCMENYDTGWHPDLSKTNKYKIFWSIDSHCVLKEHVEFSKKNKINLHLNSTEGYLKHFSFCEKSMWFPNAVDTRYYKPQDIERNIDLGFCGSIIASREPWINFMNQHYNVTVDYIIGNDMIKRLNQYKISLNQTISDDLNYRIFENLACKTPLVTNYVPGLEKLFKLDSDFLVYQSGKELIGVIKILQDNPALAKTIGENGYKTVMSKHTFEHRCNFLYNQLLEI
jgi:glycosyltransferase involved in cell wall biosynthesis